MTFQFSDSFKMYQKEQKKKLVHASITQKLLPNIAKPTCMHKINDSKIKPSCQHVCMHIITYIHTYIHDTFPYMGSKK